MSKKKRSTSSRFQRILLLIAILVFIAIGVMMFNVTTQQDATREATATAISDMNATMRGYLTQTATATISTPIQPTQATPEATP